MNNVKIYSHFIKYCTLNLKNREIYSLVACLNRQTKTESSVTPS